MFRLIAISLVVFTCCYTASGQKKGVSRMGNNSTLLQSGQYVDTVNKLFEYSSVNREKENSVLTCKNIGSIKLYVPGFYNSGMGTSKIIGETLHLNSESKSLLRVSGNILYDVNYRSFIDTPFSEKDVYQHTIQTRLDIIYKDQYPLKLFITRRFSNSDMFRDYFDFNFQFNAADYESLLKNMAIRKLEQYKSVNSKHIDSLAKILQVKKDLIAKESFELNRLGFDDKILAEKERLYYNGRKAADINVDISPVYEPGGLPAQNMQHSLRYKFPTSYYKHANFQAANKSDSALLYNLIGEKSKRQEQLDSMKYEYDSLQSKYYELSKEGKNYYSSLSEKIRGLKDVAKLSSLLKDTLLPDNPLPGSLKILSSLKNFSIGRSMANYSDLTVRNISITGLQVEFVPRFYYAVAIGKVDYRFRDYMVRNGIRNNQYVALFRFGKGNRNENHIYLSYYTGKRQLFNSFYSSSQNIESYENKMAGISIEGQLNISRHLSIVGEVAKSTTAYFAGDSLAKSKWMNAITDFNSRQNEAYSFRINSFLPSTKTKVNGTLRYFGGKFQSYTSYYNGSSQLRWNIKLEQPLLKNKLFVVSSIQQNEFNNPYVQNNYKTTSVLASVQANLRLKKWPVIFVGYFPSYQLMKIGENQYSESRFYTFTGSLGYHYKHKNKQLSTYIIFSQFYNSSNDSGFIYYNSRNVFVNQSIFSNKWTYNINASISLGSDYNLYTIENVGRYSLSRNISFGLGIKSIKHNNVPAFYWGYNGFMLLKLPWIGEIQASYDKGYLPGINRSLIDNTIGRLTFFKTF